MKPSDNTDNGENIEVKQNRSSDASLDDQYTSDAVDGANETTSSPEGETVSDTTSVTSDTENEIERNYGNQPETYEAADGTPTTLSEARTDTAAPAAVVGSKKRGANKWLLWGALVLLLAGFAALSFWFYADAQTAKNEAASLKQQLETSQTALKKQQADSAKDKDSSVKKTPITSDDDDVTSAIEATATSYACVVPGMTCDKSVKSTIINSDKFATVSFANVDGKTLTNMLLVKGQNGWVVVYEGNTATVPADVVKKFSVPADFTKF